jgi:hypothetical protein
MDFLTKNTNIQAKKHNFSVKKHKRSSKKHDRLSKKQGISHKKGGIRRFLREIPPQFLVVIPSVVEETKFDEVNPLAMGCLDYARHDGFLLIVNS